MGRRADQDDTNTREILEGIDDTEDLRVAWGTVKHRIEVLREAGRDVPEILIATERRLMIECMAESQGR